MTPLYSLTVTIHVLAAIFWLGGMFFFGLVGAPVLRKIEPPLLRQQLFQQMGRRFRTAGWWAIGLLVLTGIGNLYFRGWLRWDDVLANPEFWGTPVGHTLALKLCTVATIIIVSVVHDFVLGPLAGRGDAGSPRAIALRRRAAWLGRINALIGIVLVIAAVRLARGG